MDDLIKRKDAIKVAAEIATTSDDAVKVAKAIRAIPSANRQISDDLHKMYDNGYMAGKDEEHRWWSNHCTNCTDTSRPQKWIPCSERMPKYDENVLVYRPSMGMKIIVDNYYGFYGDDINDLDEWYEGWSASGENLVTAWMPLPTAYKGVDDE